MNQTAASPVTVELLSEMYRNVTMGSENLSAVVSKINDPHFLTNVTSQLERYAEYTNRTAELLQAHNVTPEEPSMMKKVMSRSGIAMNTMFDSSDRHIAEMIAQGTKMGADQLAHKLADFREKSGNEEVVNLCNAILDFERTEAEKMLEYV